MKKMSLVIVVSLFCFVFCAKQKENSKEDRDLLLQITKLTKKATEDKKNGQLTKAMDVFLKIDLLIKNHKSDSQIILKFKASNYDNMSIIYLRDGKYKKAERLFSKALLLLKNNKIKDAYLEGGIRRRITWMEALKKKGVTCKEPEKNDQNNIENKLQYFPEKYAMQREFASINRQMKKCRLEGKTSVTLQMLITGNGKIIWADIRGNRPHVKYQKCVKDFVLAHSNLNVRFNACFVPFSYPFVI